jgi:hypothetical protein
VARRCGARSSLACRRVLAKRGRLRCSCAQRPQGRGGLHNNAISVCIAGHLSFVTASLALPGPCQCGGSAFSPWVCRFLCPLRPSLQSPSPSLNFSNITALPFSPSSQTQRRSTQPPPQLSPNLPRARSYPLPPPSPTVPPSRRFVNPSPQYPQLFTVTFTGLPGPKFPQLHTVDLLVFVNS